MEQEQIAEALPFLKALADESRLRIVGLLAAGERSVRDLAALLKLKEPTVSHHLAILKELGIVRLRPDGNTHWYRLNDDALRALNRTLFSARKLARLGDRPDRRNWDERVLDNFLEGERLTGIPVSRKRRSVILRWLASRFEPGARYSEAEVNRIIKRYHSDCATLRREMIGYRMLHRERGVYRRLPESEWLIEQSTGARGKNPLTNS